MSHTPTIADALRAALNYHKAGQLAQAEQIYRSVLLVEPQNHSALHYLGMIELAAGRRDVGIDLLRTSLSVKPDQPSAWNNLGGALSDANRIEEAVDAYEHAVKLKSDYPLAWQNLARLLQRIGRVRDSIDASKKQQVLQPDNPTPVWNIELCERELAAENATRQKLPDGFDKWITIGVTCYGDYPQYTLRCIDSIVATPKLLDHCDVHVGCNTVSNRSMPRLREVFDAKQITTLIESNRNLNKSPIVRTCLTLCRTPYLLVVDDDSHFKPGWLDAMLEFVEKNHPFDVAGHVFEIDRNDDFQKFVVVKPWWKGVDAGHPAYRTKVFFAAGGMYIARAGFLREHNYPDRSMIIWREDAMLGDLTNQAGGKLLRWPKDVMENIFHNDGERRGEDIYKVVPATDEDFASRP